MKIRHIVLAVSACVLSPLLLGASPESALSNGGVVQSAYADGPYCGSGSYRCGDLNQNGTCCNDEDRCCYVPPSRGSCYCTSRGDSCSRY